MNFTKFTLVIFILCVNVVKSQDFVTDTTALPYLQKAEFSLLSLGVNYEFPISKALSLDSGLGFSSGAHLPKDEVRFQKNLLNPTFYLKTELKYYYNRYVRVAKKLPTRNGEGSYFALQNKFLTQRLFDQKTPLSNMMLYEVHWGIQRNLYPNLLFNAHVGLGHASDFTTKGTSFYSAIGLKVSYVFSSKKITRDSFERFW
ncbi:hypothetical protein [Flavobacterium haoranii]|uniref:Outer membrane protein beta-barrel domain-containing protein n=1 Tax=Flavobacterium haoranii TaxID=683124 RepID=A0A1M6CPB3_9FLAO|nr:hypothetical protein [Flavobacterium haoranii]SHI62799.1 hypothetical protein SAMN05444337_0430 [Flavobacterium haoranii]